MRGRHDLVVARPVPRLAAAGRLLRLGLAGQDLLGLLADHDRAALRPKAGDQADLLPRSARLIPGQEEAIGVTEFRLAVVDRQLLGGEHVLAIGPGIARLPVVFIECVDHQVAVDLDRILVLVVVEHQPAAEAARWGRALRESNRVDPDRGDLDGDPRRVAVVRPERDRRRAFHVQLGATGETGQRGRDQPA